MEERQKMELSLRMKRVDKVITDTEPPWHTTLVICRTAVRFKIDSGADTTIINEATYKLPLRKAKTQTCHY